MRRSRPAGFVNQAAMKHALGHFKLQAKVRLDALLVNWLDEQAAKAGVTRPAFLGFAIDVVRDAVNAGRVDIVGKINAMSARYRREVLEEPPEVAEERARRAAEFARRRDESQLTPEESRAKRQNDAWIAEHWND